MRYKTISELFREYSGRCFLFVEPGGNYGDSLIYMGAEKMARANLITFIAVSHEEFMNRVSGAIPHIYIHGSGGLNELWSGNPVREFKKAVQMPVELVILGPSTITENVSFLKDEFANLASRVRAKKVIVYARERTSFEIAKNIFSFAEVSIDDDTALILRKDDFSDYILRNYYTLYAYRRDKEGVKNRALNLSSVAMDPAIDAKSFKEWVTLHAKAKKIFTNRTHSAILGTIFNKEVFMFANSYHKNRSIWEHSLRDRGVKWIENFPENKFSNNSLLMRISNSYKFNLLKRKIFLGSSR